MPVPLSVSDIVNDI